MDSEYQGSIASIIIYALQSAIKRPVNPVE